MPSYDDVMQALRNADAAGNTEDARQLADIAYRMRATQDSIPAPARQPVADIPGTPAGYADRVGLIPTDQYQPAPQAQRPAPVPQEERGLFARIRGGLEAAGATIASIVPGGVGFGVGAAEGLLRNVASGKFGTQEGADLVEQTATKRAQQFTEAAVGESLSPLGKEYLQDIGEFAQRHGASVLAGPLGMTGAGRHTENVRNARQGLRAQMATAEPPPGLPPVAPSAEKPTGGLAKRVVQPNPALLEAVPAAEKAGLTVLPHHVAEGETVRALGTAAGGTVYKQNTKAFTKALIKELDPESPAEQLTIKNYHAAFDKQGRGIGAGMSRHNIPLEDMRARLEAISKDVAGNADAETGRLTTNRINDIIGKAEANAGVLKGQAARELDTAIGIQIRSNAKNQDLVGRLRDVQNTMRDAVEKQMTPAEAKEMREFRRRYAYAMEILPDIDDFGRTGYYEPGQLWKRLTGSEAGRQRVANERGGLTDLAKAGALVADRSGTGHGYVSVGGNSVGVGTGGMRAYASPGRLLELGVGAVGGSKAYNRFGPNLVRRLAAEHDAELARAAQKPEPPPLELAAPDAPTPQGPRPDVRGEAPAEVPEWTITAGVDARKPGSQIPAIAPEGLLPAVGDDMPPARINPAPRPRVPDIPAVPGRPDMPEVMVAGGPGEVAGNLASGVTGAGKKGPIREAPGMGEAMLSPDAALARQLQGYAPKKPPEPPAGGSGPAGGGGTPPTDPRLAKIADLRRQAPSAAVKKVLDAREAEIKKVIKRETDITELEAAAQTTDDVDLRQSLLAEANKLRGGKLPVGEVAEGQPDLPKPKTEKIPVGRTVEGQPELPAAPTERLPVGEATEITPEVVEAAPERLPVGEATEMPERLPVGEVAEDPIPVGEAMEFEPLPVGEATEITPEVVEPKAAATESRKDKAEASFKRRYGEGYKAAAEERRAIEEEIVNSFPTYQAGGEVVTPVIEAVERAWGRRRITMNPEGFERAVVEALRPVAERRKEWKTREKARDNDRRIKNQLAAYEKSVRDAQQDAMGELRTLERQGRLSQDEIEDLNRRIQKSETMDDAVDEMDALIMKKNQSSGVGVARRESAANEPVVPEATNVDNASTAPAGGGRSGNMEQQKSGPDLYLSLGYKPVQYYSGGELATGYTRFAEGEPVVLREGNVRGVVDGMVGITPDGEPTHYVVKTDLGRQRVPAAKLDPAPKENPRVPQEVAQQAGVRAEPESGTGGRAPAEAGAGDRVPSAAGREAKAEAPNALTMTPKQYDEAWLRKTAADNDASLAEVRGMYDTEAGRAERTQLWVQDVMSAAKQGQPISRATLDKLHEVRPRAVGQLLHDYPEAKIPDGYQVPSARKTEAEEAAARIANRKAAKTAPAAKGAQMSPAEVKAEFQRQIDAVPRFGDGGPETITLKAGGSSVKLQNTARRVAEYMKDLDTVKGGKTPKPVSEKTDLTGRGWLGGTGKRAPLKTITDMIDDFDAQAAVDFAAAQGIDLEVALKDDRKRLDRVRGLKPTPEPQEVTGETAQAGPERPQAAQKPTNVDQAPAGDRVGLTSREKDLRAKAHREMRGKDDVMLASGGGAYVSFADAVAAAKAAVASGDLDPTKPFQFNNVLDIAARDWNRMVAAMKAP